MFILRCKLWSVTTIVPKSVTNLTAKNSHVCSINDLLALFIQDTLLEYVFLLHSFFFGMCYLRSKRAWVSRKIGWYLMGLQHQAG